MTHRRISRLTLAKGHEQYVFLYDDANRGAALQMFGRFASNPELSFSWYDAAILSQQVRKNQTASRLAAKQ